MIELTPAAAAEIRRIQGLRHKPQSHLRLKVESGGCSGLFYVLDLEESPPTGDRLAISQDISIVIAAESYPHLRGLTVDYSEDLMGGGFRFHNPNALQTCSCSQSFTT